MRIDILSEQNYIEYKAVEIEPTDTPITFKKRFYPKTNMSITYVGLLWDESLIEIEYSDNQRYKFSYVFIRTPAATSNDDLYEKFKLLI